MYAMKIVVTRSFDLKNVCYSIADLRCTIGSRVILKHLGDYEYEPENGSIFCVVYVLG